MSSGATSNVQLDVLARRMSVPYFRGVFMRNALLTSEARRNESDIVNLADAIEPGTHWVAYASKRNNRVVYFDSFGNLRPPKELVRYFGNGATTIHPVVRPEFLRTDVSAVSTNDRNVREFKKLDEVL